MTISVLRREENQLHDKVVHFQITKKQHELMEKFQKIEKRNFSWMCRAALTYWFLNGCPRITLTDYEQFANLDIEAQPIDGPAD